MARSVQEESQEAQVLDHESEYPVDTPEGLEHPVGVPSTERSKRRETLVDQADIEGADPTWVEFQEMIGNPRRLFDEVVEVIQSLRDLGYQHQELKNRYKKKASKALRQEATIEGLISRQTHLATPSEAAIVGKRSAKLPDPLKFSGKLESGTTFED